MEIDMLSKQATKGTNLIPSNWSHKWSKEEDERLLSAIETHGLNWTRIAEDVKTRDSGKCYQRWTRVLRPDRVKGHWSAEEDERLIELLAQGLPNWAEISKAIGSRSSKQCRERWINYLDPSLNQNSWTTEEDAHLLQLQSQLGNQWASIAKHLAGRSENSVRGRYVTLAKALRRAAAPHIGKKRKVSSLRSNEDSSVESPEQESVDTVSNSKPRLM